MRVVKPGFFHVEASPLARLLFVGLWCLADREGRLDDRPKRISTEVLPYDEADADELLDELATGGYIQRYTVAGERYIQIVKFKEHQRPSPREAPSVLPQCQGTTQAKHHASLGTLIVDTEGEQTRRGTEGEGTTREAIDDDPVVVAFLTAAQAAGVSPMLLSPAVGVLHAKAGEFREAGITDAVLVTAAVELGAKGGAARRFDIEVERVQRTAATTNAPEPDWLRWQRAQRGKQEAIS